MATFLGQDPQPFQEDPLVEHGKGWLEKTFGLDFAALTEGKPEQEQGKVKDVEPERLPNDVEEFRKIYKRDPATDTEMQFYYGDGDAKRKRRR